SGDVPSPYDPALLPALHDLVLVATVAAGIVVALAVAARRPRLAGACAAVAVAWPTTLSGADPLRWGTIALVAALWPSVSLGAGGRRALAGACAAGAVLVAGTLVVVDAGAAPSDARVDWKGWNPLSDRGTQVGVRYVWDASYGGIQFPREPTVVLRVEGPRRAMYWRASTLDTFAGDRWIENLYPRQIAPPGRLPDDPLLPAAARRPSGWLAQEIEIAALDDDRVIGAAQPMRIEAPFERTYYLSGGVMAANRRLGRGESYTVWSYAPAPTPGELAASPARYPSDTARYLELGRARLPSFGTRDRDATVERVLRDDRYPDLAPYAPLWRQARRLAAGTGAPYVATLAIERWLRREGGFVYDERPVAPPAGTPALVHFATVGRAGYCQHYAGTMALMLRLLGIPARVAVGFSSGERVDDAWVVTDYDAHAWVEVWLAGHGWLPFDPTPGRGTLSAPYTLASDSADAVRALGTGRFLDFEPEPLDGAASSPRVPRPLSQGEATSPWLLATAALALLTGTSALAIGGTKSARRRRRLAGSDPRRVADGVRLELADVLRDHGSDVPRDAPVADLGREAQRLLGVGVERLVATTEAARYASPAQAAGAAPASRRELLLVLRAARKRVGLRRHLGARVRVRSLVRRT
ncbi:MAG: transglutaminaseTgpA domain-containing protein, partial [Gaiella sp.]